MLILLQVAVLFVLSWRLGPILASVIISTAATAALYKQQTRVVEADAARANSAMVSVASQTFSAITTVRYCALLMRASDAADRLSAMSIVLSSCRQIPMMVVTTAGAALRAPLSSNQLLTRDMHFACRSFAGEPLERERFQTYVQQSYRSGRGFGTAKANLESLNRFCPISNISSCHVTMG